MAEDKKVKLIHGLSNFHIALVEKDDLKSVEYSEVEHIEGAVSVSATVNQDSTPKYADNGIFAVLNSLNDIDVSLATIDIPASIKKKMYGNKETNGVSFSNRDDIIKEVAIGFEAKIRGGGTRFYWLLKGTPQIIGIEHETDQGAIESKDAQLELKFAPLRFNGNWKAQLDSDLVKTEDWFADVVYDESTAEALPSADEGTP